MGFKQYDKAEDLPPLWDSIMENDFQRRTFLSFLEKVNPCNQRYHLYEEKGIALITYRLKLDFFTFREKYSLALPITVVGVPLSIASAGYVVKDEAIPELAAYLRHFPLLLVLNSSGELPLPKGKTLPTFELEHYNDLEMHLGRMRSHYRYRLKKARKRGRVLLFEKINPSDFDMDMYHLYEEVYERSEGKLEKLSIDFFRQCDASLYVVFDEHRNKIAFFQYKESEKELVFLFCGLDHQKNARYDLYLNILLKILKLGEGKKIHLGQTAAYSKQRVGAEKKERYMHIGSRFLPKVFLSRLVKGLEYPHQKEMHCMKETKDEDSSLEWRKGYESIVDSTMGK